VNTKLLTYLLTAVQTCCTTLKKYKLDNNVSSAIAVLTQRLCNSLTAGPFSSLDSFVQKVSEMHVRKRIISFFLRHHVATARYSTLSVLPAVLAAGAGTAVFESL